jgi:hypothetical protein
MTQADKAFSAYIRARDEDGAGNFRCPTCGRYLPIEQADAGHYISRARMSVRYDEMNAHAQCRECNRLLEGAHVQYRKWLVEKYGWREVDALEAKARITGGYTSRDLIEIADFYKRKLKELLKERKSAWLR